MVGALAASPQPTVPSAASIRTTRFSAARTIEPAIFIGFCNGIETAIASTRWIVSATEWCSIGRIASDW